MLEHEELRREVSRAKTAPQRGMGRGLAAILSVSAEDAAASDELRDLPVELIAPNPRQPRKAFDDAALEGLAGLLDTLALVQRELNPRLTVAGMLLTMHDARTRLGRDVEREVREHFPALVFDTVIPRNVRVGEAPSFGVPVIHHDPHSSGADAYFELAKEVAARG